jgi:hypothetical protein
LHYNFRGAAGFAVFFGKIDRGVDRVNMAANDSHRLSRYQVWRRVVYQERNRIFGPFSDVLLKNN